MKYTVNRIDKDHAGNNFSIKIYSNCMSNIISQERHADMLSIKKRSDQLESLKVFRAL